MKSRLLFLDIDGVINNRKSMVAATMRAKKNGTGYTEFEGKMFPSTMWPPCVERLNRLVKEADCDVVLSSSWRYMTSYDHLGRYLRKVCGCEFDLIGSTPKTFKLDEEGRTWSRRGAEIERWRRTHDDNRPFVILDDDSDMEPHMDRLVLIGHERGMLDRHVKEALDLFGLA